jgi:CBS domain-containing protein
MTRLADVMTLRLVDVRPDETAQVAVARMLEESTGSVAVCDGGRLVGIFTERDVLRLAGEGTELAHVRVRDVMTRTPFTAAPDDDALGAAQLMGEKRIRHLPVVEDGNVLGIVAMRDVLAALVERVYRAHDEEARDTARRLLTRAR